MRRIIREIERRWRAVDVGEETRRRATDIVFVVYRVRGRYQRCVAETFYGLDAGGSSRSIDGTAVGWK